MNDDYDNAKADKAILEKLTSHTPGPWAFSEDPEGFYVWIRSEDNSDHWITERVQKIEDARLIAAAPELAEALQAILRTRGPKVTRAEAKAVFDQASAALQKAGLL